MKRALRLAAHGLFTTAANPRVGCVLVKDGEIIAEAFHQRVGEPHAEALALKQAGSAAKGCTAYVTLEPCSHTGRNPPCADALVAAGVARVVVCNDDPNPLVAGQGFDKLRQAGIKVVRGIKTKRGMALNPGFFKRMQTGKPWVRLKSAQSMDGRTAMASGESQWITGKQARADVQYWRGRSGAIITGIETVLADDCRLNFRPEALSKKHQKLWQESTENQPLRVVVDSQLRMPLDASLLQTGGPVWVVCATAEETKAAALKALGVEVFQLPDAKGQVDLGALLESLGEAEINEVLVETGATLAGAFVQQKLVDELLIYVSPVLMGSSARPLFEFNIEEMSERLHIKVKSIRSMGQDWRIKAKLSH